MAAFRRTLNIWATSFFFCLCIIYRCAYVCIIHVLLIWRTQEHLLCCFSLCELSVHFKWGGNHFRYSDDKHDCLFVLDILGIDSIEDAGKLNKSCAGAQPTGSSLQNERKERGGQTVELTCLVTSSTNPSLLWAVHCDCRLPWPSGRRRFVIWHGSGRESHSVRCTLSWFYLKTVFWEFINFLIQYKEKFSACFAF